MSLPLRIGIFGASTAGLESALELEQHKELFPITCFFDNDSNKWGTSLNKLPILQPDEKNLSSCDIILISSCYKQDIFKQVLALGFVHNIAFSVQDLLSRFHPEQYSLIKEKPTPLKLPKPKKQKALTSHTPSEAPLVAFTGCANNHIAYATTLAKSFLDQHPTGQLTIFLIDKKDPSITYPDSKDDRIEVIEAESLNIKHFERLSFQYDIYELSTAIRPYLAQHMLEKGHERIFMIDPDILLTAPFDSLDSKLQSASFLIFPHLAHPIQPVRINQELSILKSGIYNCGLMAFRDCPETQSFLNWWEQRLDRFCYNDHDRGLFVDQKWLDFAPGLFSQCKIIREPGYNTAYWNLHERTITQEQGRYLSNKEPLFCFHFSSMKPNHWQQPIERIQELSGNSLKNNTTLNSLLDHYRNSITQNGFLETHNAPYSYGCFDNGIKIAKAIRRIYSHPEIYSKFKNPFKASSSESFFNWLNSRVDKASPITQLFAQLSQPSTLQRLPISQCIDIAVKNLMESLELKNPLGLHDAFYSSIQSSIELRDNKVTLTQ